MLSTTLTFSLKLLTYYFISIGMAQDLSFEQIFSAMNMTTDIDIFTDIANSTQFQLVNRLLRNYDKKIRPVKNYLNPIKVYIKLSPYQILDVDEVNQFIMMNVWMQEIWYDDFLFWNPEDFDNISEIKIPTEDVWRPDTFLYNNLEIDKESSHRLINVQMKTLNIKKQRGKVTLQYPAIYRTSCTMDIANFPFDMQHCILKFGSWTYDNTAIDYFAADIEIDIQYLVNNEQWTVLRFTSNRLVTLYACCPNPYTTINFHIWIQRRPLFYTINLVVPSVVVIFINFIGFFTPTSNTGERKEKVTLGVTTLLAMGVQLLQLTDHTPHSSTSVPLMGKFILLLIIMVGLGTVMSCIVIHLHHRGFLGHRPTPTLRTFLYCFCFLLSNRNRKRLKNPAHCPKARVQKYSFCAVDNSEEHVFTGIDSSISRAAKISIRLSNVDKITKFNAFYSKEQSIEEENTIEKGADERTNSVDKLCHSMMDELCGIKRIIQKFIRHQEVKKEQSKVVEIEWIMAATALERLCFILFNGAAISLTVSLFLFGNFLQSNNLISAMTYNYSLDT